MKTVAKVFGILSIIGSAIALAIFFIYGLLVCFGLAVFAAAAAEAGEGGAGAAAGFAVGIPLVLTGLFMICPIVINAAMLKKLKTARAKKDLIAIGVLTIVLGGNVVSGVMCFCLRDKDLQPEQAPAPVQ